MSDPNEEIVEINSRSDSPNTTTDSTASSTKSETSIRLGKELELLMEALNTLETPEQRVATLCKKYSDLLEDKRLLGKHLKKSQKEINHLKAEKDQLYKERECEIKARLAAEKLASTHKAAAAKLESLCRELQKQNRSMKQEMIQKSKTEEENRKALIDKFQGSLEEITKSLEKNSEFNNTLKQDNDRLSSVIGEYKHREEQYSKVINGMKEREDLMEQKMVTLEEARKMDGAKLNETLNDLMEKTQMTIQLVAEKEQLHKQVHYYSERFEDFNDTLSKSNEAISGFSAEMQKLQRINTRLEKNAEDWKLKHFNCQQQLILLTESNLKQSEKNQKLEKLCRALQERQSNAAKPNDGLKPTENGVTVKSTSGDEEKENQTNEIEQV